MKRRFILLLPALWAWSRASAQTLVSSQQVRINLLTLLRAVIVEETPQRDATNPLVFRLTREPAMLCLFRNGVHQRPAPAPSPDYTLSGKVVTFEAFYSADTEPPLVYAYYLALA